MYYFYNINEWKWDKYYVHMKYMLFITQNHVPAEPSS